MLGKRFPLDTSPLRIGRGSENTLVLEGDSVSRRHARLEYRDDKWWCYDEGSTNGTFVNDRPVAYELPLANGARIKVGSTIFKYLSGHDVEAQYHEEIYRLTIVDGLTEAHVKRYLLESLEKEILRARRRSRDLSALMFDIDHFKKINDAHGYLAGDYVLKELARVVLTNVRADDVIGRYGGEEFALVLPETGLAAAKVVGETLRDKIAQAQFTFQNDADAAVTISVGVACLVDEDKVALDIIRRADEKLYEAKRGGVAESGDGVMGGWGLGGGVAGGWGWGRGLRGVSCVGLGWGVSCGGELRRVGVSGDRGILSGTGDGAGKGLEGLGRGVGAEIG